jgi:broad specificity phosphatase PhoE
MTACLKPFPFPYTNLEVGDDGRGGSVVVIRHGERVDEVKHLRAEWLASCKDQFGHCRETFYCRVNDPPLTENGKLQAKEVANTLKGELLNSMETPQIIFSSKLTRSLMTAYEIAKELGLPICVSRGFAMTASAVAKKGAAFAFLSFEEMQDLCPGVLLIDGDMDIFHPPQQRASARTSRKTRSQSDNGLHHIPDKTWQQSLEFLSDNWRHSIVVAHRESIRNLSGMRRLRTPFYSFGIFNYQTRSSVGLKDKVAVNIEHVAERCGKPIELPLYVSGCVY